jgi:RNase P subunit RPR2
MDQKTFHGNLKPADLATALVAHFNRGNFRVQQFVQDDKVAVQIATIDQASSGGQTAMSVFMQKVEDGVMVQVGQQGWIGIAASLGLSALATLANPWNLLTRLDDVAQDIQSLQLRDEVMEVVDKTAQALGSGFELSSRLKRVVCSYCGVANPVGEPACVACGAPLGDRQPTTCRRCGFVIRLNETRCPNCGNPV